jgi:hypothetical protein
MMGRSPFADMAAPVAIDPPKFPHRQKLAWAKEHLARLQAASDRLRDQVSYQFVPDPPHNGNTYVRLKYAVDVPPEWGLIASDALHHLRASLDAIAFALAVHHSGFLLEQDASGVQFVIANTPDEFSKARKRWLKHLSPEAIAAIEAVQPYQPTTRKNGNPMRMLRDLNNYDKHRNLLVTYANVREGTIRIRGTDPRSREPFELVALINKGIMRNGAIVATYRLPTGISQEQVQMTNGFGLFYAILHPSSAGLWPVLDLLRHITRFLEEDVFPKLDAHLMASPQVPTRGLSDA